jgi:hypothetical protein
MFVAFGSFVVFVFASFVYRSVEGLVALSHTQPAMTTRVRRMKAPPFIYSSTSRRQVRPMARPAKARQ